MKRFTPTTLLTLFSALLFLGAACDSSEEVTEANFEVTIENIGMEYALIKSGSFAVPVGASAGAPIFPGDAYEFEFTAPKGSRLSFATMFVQSNDWFYAPDEDGIALYNADGSQVLGDVTAQINLYDAGTEADEPAGEGANQAPRQSGANTGAADTNTAVRLVTESGLPVVSDVINVTFSSTSSTGFKVRIENVSTATTLQTSTGTVPVPLAPGVWAVHSASQSAVLFTLGQTNGGFGLEGVAEDGSFGDLQTYLEGMAGLTVPLAPGAFAVYTNENPIFMNAVMTPNNGLEGLAEDGNIAEIETALAATANVRASGGFAIPLGASSAGPLTPGNSYQFTFTGQEGDYLNFATMFIQSNDLFYGASDTGIQLFENGTPISGNITSMISLWDAGTEENEEPGIGANQAPRQTAANTGSSDSNSKVRMVNDSFSYPDKSNILRVTIRVVQ